MHWLGAGHADAQREAHQLAIVEDVLAPDLAPLVCPKIDVEGSLRDKGLLLEAVLLQVALKAARPYCPSRKGTPLKAAKPYCPSKKRGTP